MVSGPPSGSFARAVRLAAGWGRLGRPDPGSLRAPAPGSRDRPQQLPEPLERVRMRPGAARKTQLGFDSTGANAEIERGSRGTCRYDWIRRPSQIVEGGRR